MLYPVVRQGVGKPEPDWSHIHRELKRKGVTLHLLWMEYRTLHPDGYVYSRFCQLYRKWHGQVDPVLRQDHRGGQKLFVDFAGQTVTIVDSVQCIKWQAPVFVATMGASNYSYAEVVRSQDLESWVGAHINTFEFLGGVPHVIVPDNIKSGVSRSCRYDPDLNPTYQELAMHYGNVVIPARPSKPRDKAKVESAVGVVSKWILAPLRDREFFSLREANQAISERLTMLNEKPFQKIDGSRKSMFDLVDRPALKPLPPERYVIARWKKARVNVDYHIQLEGNYFSVPYQMVREEVDVRFTDKIVEILWKGKRVASHMRPASKGKYVTEPAHRPASHQKHLEWTPSRLIRWASEVGPATAEVVKTILESKPHPEQGYRSCLGIMSLAKRYPHERLEAASKRALATHAVFYQSIKSILSNGLDRLAVDPPSELSTPPHENIRGAAYYAEKGAKT